MEKTETALMADWLLKTTRHSLVIRANIMTEGTDPNHIWFALYSQHYNELYKVSLRLWEGLTLVGHTDPNLFNLGNSTRGITPQIDQDVFKWNRGMPFWFEDKLVVLQETRNGTCSPIKCGLDFLPHLYRLHGILGITGDSWPTYRHFQQRLGAYLTQQTEVARKAFQQLWDFDFS